MPSGKVFFLCCFEAFHVLISNIRDREKKTLDIRFVANGNFKVFRYKFISLIINILLIFKVKKARSFIMCITINYPDIGTYQIRNTTSNWTKQRRSKDTNSPPQNICIATCGHSPNTYFCSLFGILPLFKVSVTSVAKKTNFLDTVTFEYVCKITIWSKWYRDTWIKNKRKSDF